MNHNYTVFIDKNRFYLGEDKLIGEITYYENEDGQIVVDHTYVNPEYRGQNLGKILVDAVVKHANKENKKIIPLCPYVEKVFSRNSDYDYIWFK
jgi:hypothetical protein